ncbi:hypothetical protein [Streptomyces sp. NPDC052015]|uniref:hypothetical protein n=1 Tax=Streptomyces sp. NPDC052015 TaxID=3154755 RepID=UPI00341FA124
MLAPSTPGQSCRIVNDQVFGHGPGGRAVSRTVGDPSAPRAEPPADRAATGGLSLVETRRERAMRPNVRPARYGAGVPWVLSVRRVPDEPLPPGRAVRVSHERLATGAEPAKDLVDEAAPAGGAGSGKVGGGRVEAVIARGGTGGRPGAQVEGLPCGGAQGPEGACTRATGIRRSARPRAGW